jgi:hypothetical protein
MAIHNPVFTSNLYGGLSRHAMNSFAQAVRQVNANSEGVTFSQAQVFERAPTKSVLASIESATLYSDNRWTYSVKIWFPTPIGGGGITVPTADLSGTYTAAVNLREWHNTLNIVDGMNISVAPAATIGPVGSQYNTITNVWPTTQLSAKVELHICYDSSGATFAYFDRPNPVRCTPAEQ